MRRRDVLAGLGSLGVVGAGAAVAINGLPSPSSGSETDDTNTTDDTTTVSGPVTIQTLDAPGSTAGEVSLPAADQPTFIDFFATWCDPCEEQMPALAEAHDRLGNDVLFISVTTEPVGRFMDKSKVIDWWQTNNGNWSLGIDPDQHLASALLRGKIPYAVAIDTSGTVQWSDQGIKTADQLVSGIERALEPGGQ